MDFTLSLAHFCDNHGPTSILCTRVSSPPCSTCQVQTPISSVSTTTTSSYEDKKGIFLKANVLSTKKLKVLRNDVVAPQLPTSDLEQDNDQAGVDLDRLGSTDTERLQRVPSGSQAHPARRHAVAKSGFQEPNNASDSFTPLPSRRLPSDLSQSSRPPMSPRTLGLSSSECANCKINIPGMTKPEARINQNNAKASTNSSMKNSSPTLRSKLPVRVYDEIESGYYSDSDSDHHHNSHHHSSSSFARRGHSNISIGESFDSAPSTTSSSFHEHTLTYISTHSPLEPNIFSDLRKSIVRTLSGEELPRGLTGGPIFFGTAADGYTIAYTFRLPDRFARGGRRLYSFVALAGHDIGRASRAVPVCWRHFKAINAWISAAVDMEARQAEASIEIGKGTVNGMGPEHSLMTTTLESSTASIRSTEAIPVTNSLNSSADIEQEASLRALITPKTPPSTSTITTTITSPDAGGSISSILDKQHEGSTKKSISSFLTGRNPGSAKLSAIVASPHIPTTSDISLNGVDKLPSRHRRSSGTLHDNAFRAGTSSTAVAPLMGRSLVDMTGDDQVFVKIHTKFMALLLELTN